MFLQEILKTPIPFPGREECTPQNYALISMGTPWSVCTHMLTCTHNKQTNKQIGKHNKISKFLKGRVSREMALWF